MLNLTVIILFALGVNAFCQGLTPVIINYSHRAGSGDFFYVQGSDFGDTPSLQYSYNDDKWINLAARNSGHGVLAAQLPPDTRLPDIISVRVSADRNSWSSPILINQPMPLSFDSDEVISQSSFRIFGRNLILGSKEPSVRFVDSLDGSSQAATVDMAASSHWALKTVAPPNLSPGHRYSIYVSNGYNGSSWAPIEVAAPTGLLAIEPGRDYWNIGTPWAHKLDFYQNRYNVKTDPRLGNILATGDGVANDMWPIMHAIQVASAAGGGVVYLPPGKYALDFPNGCGVPLKHRVVVQGAGKDVSSIIYGFPSGTTGGYAVCFDNQSGISDVSLVNIDNQNHWQQSSLSQNHEDVFITRVNWDLGTSQWLTFAQDRHVAIEDSVISQGIDRAFNYLGVLNVQDCSQCLVARNKIQFAVGGLLFDGAKNLVFEHNIVTRDISAPQDPGVVSHVIAASFVENLVLANNQIGVKGQSPATENDGEVLNSEAGGGTRWDEFRGNIYTATSDTLTDVGQDFLHSKNYSPAIRAGATVAIISGNALGQTRTITSVSSDGKTIGVNRPWNVVPETGSHYATFDWSALNWTVVNNVVTGNFKGFEIFNASAENVLIERNSLTDSGGIMVSPSENEAFDSGPALFNFIADLSITGNTITNNSGLRPAYIGVLPREDRQTVPFGTHVIGATIRNNNVVAHVPNSIVSNPSWDDHQAVTEGFLNSYYWQSNSPYLTDGVCPILSTILQGNTAINSKSAFFLNSGACGTIIADGFTENVGMRVQDMSLPGAGKGADGSVMSNPLSLFSTGAGQVRGTVTSSGQPGLIVGLGQRNYSLSRSAQQSAYPPIFGRALGFNAEISVHVQANPQSDSRGILLMRGGTAPDSPFVSIGLQGSSLIFEERPIVSGDVRTRSFPFSTGLIWLKLRRKGRTVTALYSQDGVNWDDVSTSISFPSRVYLAGVSTSPGTNSSSASDVVFDSLTFGPSSVVPVATAANHGPSRVPQPLRLMERLVVLAWKGIRFVAHRLI